MTLYEYLGKVLSENFCQTGKTDKDGLYRHISSGNELFVVKNKTGYAFRCVWQRDTGAMGVVKYSIDSKGNMRNCGKSQFAYMIDIEKYALKATKFAILTPLEEHNENKKGNYNIPTMLKWKNIEELYKLAHETQKGHVK